MVRIFWRRSMLGSFVCILLDDRRSRCAQRRPHGLQLTRVLWCDGWEQRAFHGRDHKTLNKVHAARTDRCLVLRSILPYKISLSYVRIALRERLKGIRRQAINQRKLLKQYILVLDRFNTGNWHVPCKSNQWNWQVPTRSPGIAT